MSILITKLSNYTNQIASFLPQNQHTQKTQEISQELEDLKAAITDKTTQTFKSKFNEIINISENKKNHLIKILRRLNGKYFQDPKSSLKKSWDEILICTQKAGLPLPCRSMLNGFLKDLNKSIPKEVAIKNSIEKYIRLEKKRDWIQAKLKKLLKIEKNSTSSDLSSKKNTLLKRKNFLCGTYFGDPNGLLHQAWLTDSSAYEKLEKERKAIEAELWLIDSQDFIESDTTQTYESLTLKKIKADKKALENQLSIESAAAGVDWKKTVLSATTLATLALGYIDPLDLI